MRSSIAAADPSPLDHATLAWPAGADSAIEPHVFEGGEDGAAWDRLVTQFRDANCDQIQCYGAEIWGAQRLSRLEVRQEARTIGAAQVVILRAGKLSYGLAYVKFGPLWQRSGRPPDIRHLQAILRALKYEYALKRRLHLMVLPPPDPEHRDVMAEELRSLGFVQRMELTDPNRYLVNLRLSEDEQMRSLAQKWRYNLRRAERHGIAISRSSSVRDLETFKGLYAAMVARKQFAGVPSPSIVQALHDGLPADERPQIVLAHHQEQPVAGAVITRFGDTATYLFGASNDDSLRLNAGYAMHWRIVRWLSETHSRWYDLGGEAQEPGLRQFKKGLVGKAGCILQFPGEFELSGGRGSELFARAVFALRRARFAYRHLRSKKRY